MAVLGGNVGTDYRFGSAYTAASPIIPKEKCCVRAGLGYLVVPELGRSDSPRDCTPARKRESAQYNVRE